MSFEVHLNNTDSPEVLAVAVLPSAEDRRRRVCVLVRLLVIILEMLPSKGRTVLAVKIETAKDVIRGFKFVYPEAMAI
jgi:hypothetical protein